MFFYFHLQLIRSLDIIIVGRLTGLFPTLPLHIVVVLPFSEPKRSKVTQVLLSRHITRSVCVN